MKKLILFYVCLFLAVPCQARIITIDDDGHADFNNIQAAIDDANDGDTVLVADGIYTGPGNRGILFHDKAITVRSENGPENCMVDCEYLNRGFTFHYVDANSILRGITIQRGNYNRGGGIYCSETSSPIIENCIIAGCRATSNITAYGGGIYCSETSSPIIENCVITGCRATSSNSSAIGGGIYCSGSTIIENCEISYNIAEVLQSGSPGLVAGGGGIYCEGSPTLIRCTVAYNQAIGGDDIHLGGNGANAYGGGIYAHAYGDVTVIDCVITENMASGGAADGSAYSQNGNACGGGIYGKATVRNSKISYNRVEGGGDYIFRPEGNAYGGGIYCLSGPITNCLVVGNGAEVWSGVWAEVRGTGIYLEGDIVVDKCTILHNESYEGGASVDGQTSSTSHPTITNSIIWDNNGPDVSNCTAEYCCIEDVYPGTGNIHVDPFFSDDYDYHLKSQAGRWNPNTESWFTDAVTSPCIDAGDPLSPIGQEAFPNGGIINMGAYGGTVEASKSYFGQPVCVTIVAGDVNGDCKVNFLDFRLMSLHWLEGLTLPPLPGQASFPYPADGAIAISPSANLTWTAGSDATSHDVFFGNNNPPPFMCNQTSTTFEPGTMALQTTYYWRIDEVNSSGKTTGPVWSFTTGPPPPPE